MDPSTFHQYLFGSEKFMQIIDMRLRPPLPEFLLDGPIALYSEGQLDLFSKYLGTRISPAAKARSMEMFFAEMEEAKIDKGIIHARKSNGVPNEIIRDFVNVNSGKFIGCINTVPTEGVDFCLNEIDEYVINGPCQGLFLEPTVDCWKIDDEKIAYPIYEKCSENNIPALFTLGGMAYSLSMRAETLPAVDKIAKEFPNLKIVFCHGAWPAATEVIQMALMRGNIYISQDLYLINLPFRQDYIQAGNYALSDRILYGSAYPAADMRDAVNFYMNCGFRQEVLPQIMGGNAAQLFDGEPVKSIVQSALSKLNV